MFKVGPNVNIYIYASRRYACISFDYVTTTHNFPSTPRHTPPLSHQLDIIIHSEKFFFQFWNLFIRLPIDVIPSQVVKSLFRNKYLFHHCDCIHTYMHISI